MSENNTLPEIREGKKTKTKRSYSEIKNKFMMCYSTHEFYIRFSHTVLISFIGLNPETLTTNKQLYSSLIVYFGSYTELNRLSGLSYESFARKLNSLAQERKR